MLRADLPSNRSRSISHHNIRSLRQQLLDGRWIIGAEQAKSFFPSKLEQSGLLEQRSHGRNGVLGKGSSGIRGSIPKRWTPIHIHSKSHPPLLSLISCRQQCRA